MGTLGPKTLKHSNYYLEKVCYVSEEFYLLKVTLTGILYFYLKKKNKSTTTPIFNSFIIWENNCKYRLYIIFPSNKELEHVFNLSFMRSLKYCILLIKKLLYCAGVLSKTQTWKLA